MTELSRAETVEGLRATRLKFIDYDSRPKPKTRHFCIACQQDLDPTKPYRTVRITGDMFAVYPGDGQPNRGTPNEDKVTTWPIGPDCAKRLGLEWSLPMPALKEKS